MPTIAQPTGLAKGAGKFKGWGKLPPAPGKKPNSKTGKDLPRFKYDTRHEMPENISSWDRIKLAGKPAKPVPGVDQEKTDTVGQLRWFIASPKSPAINTSFGERPVVPLEGKSDPSIADENAAEARQYTAAELQHYQKNAGQNFGESEIYPDIETENLRHKNTFAKAPEHSTVLPPLHDISEEHRAVLDADAETMLRDEANQ